MILFFSVIGLIVLACIIIYFFFPKLLVNLMNSQNARSAGLEKKVMQIDGYEMSYFENKNNLQKDTLILLHGLADDKNSFVPAAKKLSGKYHLILPDLAGHGENVRDEDMDYSIRGQVEFLNKFINEKKLGEFHLAGNSMGGHISAAYALRYPEKIKSLILVNAPGLSVDDHVVYGGFGDIIRTREELNVVLKRIFYKVPNIPGPIAQHMIEQINSGHDFVNNNVIPQILKGKDYDLLNRISEINVPTLILWGKHDVVVRLNVAEKFAEEIPGARRVMLDEASHSPQLEIPDRVSEEIDDFIVQAL